MSTDVELRAAWWSHVGDDSALFDRLLRRYRERHRHYHGSAHVTMVVRHVLELAAIEDVDDPDVIVAAAFYHDAVYEPRNPANERASGRLARRDLEVMRHARTWDAVRIDAVVSMIEGTTTHLDPPEVDTAVLFDADLAVLGADVAGYNAYRTGVRAEYHHVADDDWRIGRAAVLDTFLARAAIYATTSGHERWEARARANITGELSTLHG